MYETVMEEIGKPIVFNICMLGAVIHLTNVVKPKSVMKILEKKIPADFLEMNRKALNIGIRLGKAPTA
jgi:2-oxoglutarate ferredoxin oxidoreductase subunit gamma